MTGTQQGSNMTPEHGNCYTILSPIEKGKKEHEKESIHVSRLEIKITTDRYSSILKKIRKKHRIFDRWENIKELI